MAGLRLYPKNLMRVMPPKGTCLYVNGIASLFVVSLFFIKSFTTMKAEINKKEIEVKAGINTLAELLADNGFTGIGQAVAVNNRVVPKADWVSFKLEDGMKITVIRAVCGG